MLTALKGIIIEFDGNAETLDMEEVIKYDGDKDLSQVRSLEAIANTSEMTLSFLGDGAHVKLIVPHKMGHSDASYYVYPCYYEIKYGLSKR